MPKSASRRTFLLLSVMLVLAVLINRDQTNGGILDLLRTSLMKESGDGTVFAQISSAADEEVNAAAALQGRLALYRRRYGYHPAAPRPTGVADTKLRTHDGQSMYNCGNATDNFAAWFSRPNGNGRSINDEDKTMYNTFFRQLGTDFRGTFVEMGAFNGLTESNSNFFETCLGWEGILIEANPVQWPHLIQNRPYAHRFHFAPSCNETAGDNATLPFYDSLFTNAGLATSDVKSAYTNNFIKGEPVQVPCASLTNVLLDIFPIGHITFFSLDVEGSEHLVLGNAIDFSKVFIEVLMVEQWNGLCPAPPNHCESREKVRSIMRDNGYMLRDKLVKKSDVYVHPLAGH